MCHSLFTLRLAASRVAGDAESFSKKLKKEAMADRLLIFLAQSPKIKDHSLIVRTTNNLKMGEEPESAPLQG